VTAAVGIIERGVTNWRVPADAHHHRMKRYELEVAPQEESIAHVQVGTIE